MQTPEWRDLRVTQVRHVAHDVVELRLESDTGGPLPPWSPGAHLEIETPGGQIRHYSLCGRADEPRSYTIAVLREPGGRGGSEHLHSAVKLGSMVRVRGPRNHFELVPGASDYVLVAGGIGITPLKAMAEHLEATGQTWRLHYGGRSLTSMAYADDLVALDPASVQIHPEDEQGQLGLAAILASVGPATSIYCCGPAALLDAASGAVADSAAHDLHIERFTASATSPVAQAPSDSFTVELAITGVEIEVAPDQSILQAVRSALPDTPSSCEEGYCGTCETRVLDGNPEHRDTVLTASEQARNDTMMICVGRSLSPRLVLEL